jgi:hypothetical protein
MFLLKFYENFTVLYEYERNILFREIAGSKETQCSFKLDTTRV